MLKSRDSQYLSGEGDMAEVRVLPGETTTPDAGDHVRVEVLHANVVKGLAAGGAADPTDGATQLAEVTVGQRPEPGKAPTRDHHTGRRRQRAGRGVARQRDGATQLTEATVGQRPEPDKALPQTTTPDAGDNVRAEVLHANVVKGLAPGSAADPTDGATQLAEAMVGQRPEPDKILPDASPKSPRADWAPIINAAGRVIEGVTGLFSTPDALHINDERFIHDLDKLKDIRSFFIQEAVSLADTRALSFGELNLLRFSEKGRPPTGEEWSKIEEFTRILFSSLTEPLRRKYRLAGIPWIVAVLPVIFIVLALGSVILAILGTQGPILGFSKPGANVLPFYLIWLISLGAIGAVAFIGMNALSVQEDITFDLTNRRLMILRVVLGGLFGLVLTLPFGFQQFINFCSNVGGAAAIPNGIEKSGGESVTWQAVTLLSPFVLGFSTSLVILVLNQLVDGIQAFFGKRSTERAIAPLTDPRTVPLHIHSTANGDTGARRLPTVALRAQRS
jgi:hypothetical protein